MGILCFSFLSSYKRIRGSSCVFFFLMACGDETFFEIHLFQREREDESERDIFLHLLVVRIERRRVWVERRYPMPLYLVCM